MVFSSIPFLFYFLPLFLLVYTATPGRFKNFLLVLFSLAFYGWWSPKYIALILVSGAVDYGCGLWVARLNEPARKKSVLWISILTNLSILGFFKYCNFFLDSINTASGVFGADPLPAINVILPIGISFYTFQSMSYTIDIYRGIRKPEKNPIDFLAYITLFPQLVAGPIIRYKDISNQLKDRTQTAEKILRGIQRFCVGIIKKVMIADALAPYADHIFSLPPGDLNILVAWTGILFFSLEIYFDFSGYSDMAIGLGKLIGFNFPENFNQPYLSTSITDFWRRWHISLSTWLKDYLYIPLGGNRKGTSRTYLNLIITMLLGGLWHGASWIFVAWGLYHGLILSLEKFIRLPVGLKIPIALRHFYALFLIALGWAIFRSESPLQLTGLVTSMFGRGGIGSIDQLLHYYNMGIWVPLAMAYLFTFKQTILSKPRYINSQLSLKKKWALARPILIALLFLWCAGSIVSQTYRPFIYFQF